MFRVLFTKDPFSITLRKLCESRCVRLCGACVVERVVECFECSVVRIGPGLPGYLAC